jgi:hypothetical protein
VLVVVMTIGMTVSNEEVAAYSYSTSGYYLSEIDGDDSAYSYHSIDYGGWSCGFGICSIPIYQMLQYVNVWYTSESFSCWYQEVYTLYFYNIRNDSQTIDYGSTPWYNYQSGWGYADSNGGDQNQIVSIGNESSECGAYGAGGGLHFASGIVRNSSSAYTWFYGW